MLLGFVLLVLIVLIERNKPNLSARVAACKIPPALAGCYDWLKGGMASKMSLTKSAGTL
jgi:hypothetical protein